MEYTHQKCVCSQVCLPKIRSHGPLLGIALQLAFGLPLASQEDTAGERLLHFFASRLTNRRRHLSLEAREISMSDGSSAKNYCATTKVTGRERVRIAKNAAVLKWRRTSGEPIFAFATAEYKFYSFVNLISFLVILFYISLLTLPPTGNFISLLLHPFQVYNSHAAAAEVLHNRFFCVIFNEIIILLHRKVDKLVDHSFAYGLTVSNSEKYLDTISELPLKAEELTSFAG